MSADEPRTARRTGLVVAATAIGCVVAVLVAWSTLARPVPDQRGEAAAAEAISKAWDLTDTLTREADDRRTLDDAAFEAEMSGVVQDLDPDQPVEVGEGRVGWRRFFLGSAGVEAGGWLSSQVFAMLCVDITVDRHATPLVHLADVECDPEDRGGDPDLLIVRLPTPFPPEQPET